MKYLFIFLATSLVSMAQAQTGYNITVSAKPYKNQQVYLGYHYGKLKALADSVKLDANSKGVFKGKTKLPGGIYFLVSPKKEILFEMLIDKQQTFSVVGDSANLPSNVVYTGSPDNTLFQSYSTFINANGSQIARLTEQIKSPAPGTDTAVIGSQLRTLSAQIQQYRDDVEKKNPASILSMIFRSMREPVVPSPSKQPGGKYDSAFAYQYYKNHYWDGISFADERLLRTPIFEPRLEKYYKDLVVPDPDSLKKEIDIMIAKTGNSTEMYKFLLTYFVQKYINPEYMGQDAVFVHLFEKYINNNPKVDWFTAQYQKYMFERAYSLMANLIGQPAADLNMVDSMGKAMPLSAVNADYTVVCFWDATCSHCKEVVPKVDSIFQAKWKKQGVKVYGVMVDGGKPAWTQFIKENGLKDWIHVYESQEQKDAVAASGKAGYKQLYDVYQTPVLYLLDKEKRIVAKKLTYLQIDQLIDAKRKTASK